MFGFHKRSRSLIPVGDLEKSEKMAYQTEEEKCEVTLIEEEQERTNYTPGERRNLIMIYLLFLAEAIMASSLSTQVNVLLPSATGCLDVNTSLLRSVLECAYFFGSATGMFWGFVADRIGRRRVALIGLGGMATCCLCMGFAATLPAFAVLRFVSGAISSAVTIAGLAMLADHTHGSSSRTSVVARLPVVALGGSLGPLVSGLVKQLGDGVRLGVFARFPGLSAQMACAGLVVTVGIAEAMLLRETLPRMYVQPISPQHYLDSDDDEKVAFLGQSLSNDSRESLTISIIDALNDDAATPLPSRITILHMLTAPSVLILLASYALLSLHSSTFDVLLPHLGHTPSHHAGMGIPCAWLGPVTLAVKIVAALRIMHSLPTIVRSHGLLKVYRSISLVFPALYILIPTLALILHLAETPALVSAVFSTIFTLAKTSLSGAAQVLVLLLVLSAAPDASSTGTLIGVVSLSELFKALAVAVAGVTYYLSDEYALVVVNTALWTALAVIALLGAAVTWKLRETPRVGMDIPEECLAWQGVFDVESDEEGF